MRFFSWLFELRFLLLRQSAAANQMNTNFSMQCSSVNNQLNSNYNMLWYPWRIRCSELILSGATWEVIGDKMLQLKAPNSSIPLVAKVIENWMELWIQATCSYVAVDIPVLNNGEEKLPKWHVSRNGILGFFWRAQISRVFSRVLVTSFPPSTCSLWFRVIEFNKKQENK